MADFSLRRRLEREYERGIQALYQKKIIQNLTGLTAAQTVQYLSSIGNTAEVQRLAENLAARMVSTVRIANASSWKEAARKGTMSRQVYLALRNEFSGAVGITASDIVRSNALLISSVPSDMAKRFASEIYRMTQQGLRSKDITAKLIAQAPNLIRTRAALIARTEASKANSAMTEARSAELGADWYIWRTCHDERVRNSHKYMDGVLVTWNDPPNPEVQINERNAFGKYHAGCCPNCRCYAEPLIDAENLPDTLQVHQNGKIEKMSKRRFMVLAHFN